MKKKEHEQLQTGLKHRTRSMGSTSGGYERGNNASTDRRGTFSVLRGGRSDRENKRTPSRKATTVAAIVIAIMLPELHIYAGEENAWTVYLTLSEIAKAVLCLSLAVPAFRVIPWAGALWFMTQAADEVTNGNIWVEHKWEYWVLLALSVAIAVYYLSGRKRV